MKQLSIIIIILLSSVFSIGQNKDTTIALTKKASTKEVVRPKIDTLTLFDEKPVAKYKTKSDTLVVADVKFIKVGDKTIEKAALEKAAIILLESDLQLLFNQLQEFPARCANPVTEWLSRFFGFTPQKSTPPKQ